MYILSVLSWVTAVFLASIYSLLFKLMLDSLSERGKLTLAIMNSTLLLISFTSYMGAVLLDVYKILYNINPLLYFTMSFTITFTSLFAGINLLYLLHVDKVLKLFKMDR